MDNKVNNEVQLGFVWDISSVRGSEVVEERVHNLVPTEGMNHILDVVLKSGAQKPNWYIALFEGDYTPTPTVTAANFTATATECVAYTELNRVPWVAGAISAGALDNVASPALFSFTSNKTIYGAALISDNTKGGGIGTILSIVRFSSPRINPESLSVKAGIALVNV